MKFNFSTATPVEKYEIWITYFATFQKFYNVYI